MKAYKIDGDEFADLVHWQSPTGKLVIDVMMNTLTPREARGLGQWLIKAADYVVKENRKRKPGGARGE